jgi:hypothetical protein
VLVGLIIGINDLVFRLCQSSNGRQVGVEQKITCFWAWVEDFVFLIILWKQFVWNSG